MWYVIPHDKTISEHLATQPMPFDNFDGARDKAEYLRKDTGKQYHVIKIQVVWTTQTMAEAMARG